MDKLRKILHKTVAIMLAVAMLATTVPECSLLLHAQEAAPTEENVPEEENSETKKSEEEDTSPEMKEDGKETDKGSETGEASEEADKESETGEASEETDEESEPAETDEKSDEEIEEDVIEDSEESEETDIPESEQNIKNIALLEADGTTFNTGNEEADQILSEAKAEAEAAGNVLDQTSGSYGFTGNDNKILYYQVNVPRNDNADFYYYHLYIKPLEGSDGILNKPVGNSSFFREVYVGDGIKEISDYFTKNSYYYLEKVELPDTVTKIGNYAFRNCEYLEKINLCNVTEIGDYAFAGCSIMTDLNSDLSKVKSIGESAFYRCEAISNNLNLESIEEIGPSAFYGCNAVGELIIGQKSDGNAISVIPKDTFCGMTSLKKIVIPDSVITIGEGAFCGTGSSTAKDLDLTIGKGISSIDVDAFKSCRVNAIHYNGTLEDWCRIEFGSLYSNPMATHITTNRQPTEYPYTFYMDGQELTAVTVPDTITEIKDYAFAGIQNVEEIRLPKSVATIGKLALYRGHGVYFTDVYIYNRECSIAEDTEPLVNESYKGAAVTADTLWGYKDSTTYTYAYAHRLAGITFSEIIDCGYDERYIKGEPELSYAMENVGYITFTWDESEWSEQEDPEAEYIYNICYHAGSSPWEVKSFVLDGEEMTDLPADYFADGAHKTEDGKNTISVEVLDFAKGRTLQGHWRIEKSAMTVTGDPGAESTLYTIFLRSGEVNNYGGTRNEYTAHKGTVNSRYNGMGFIYYSEISENARQYDDRLSKSLGEIQGAAVHVTEDLEIVPALYDTESYCFVSAEELNKIYHDVSVTWALEYYDNTEKKRIVQDTEGEYLKLVTESDAYKDGGYSNWISGISIPPSEFTYTNAVVGGTTTETGTGRAYIRVSLSSDSFGTYEQRIPIWVLEAEEGVTYQKWNTASKADEIIQTQEELYDTIRKNLVERTGQENGFLNFEVTASSTALPGYLFSMDAVYDMYGEREGMKPYEGDYLQFTAGHPSNENYIGTDYEISEKYIKGKKCYVYTFSVPYITTAEQEEQVTAKIDALLSEGGALYEVNQNGSKEEKAKAAYDWVVAHVSATNGSKYNRKNPIYHTAYSALINGHGTCQAFALVYYRLCREMGVNNKIIMGTDANAHTYNIVELDDGYYYYADTSAKQWKVTYPNFQRTTEQSKFRTGAYVINYISKIKDYNLAAADSVTVYNQKGDVVCQASSLLEAKDIIIGYINADLAAAESDEEYEISKYRVVLNKDVTLESSEDLDYGQYIDVYGNCVMRSHFYQCCLGDYSDWIEIDLNGHKVTLKKKSDNVIRAGLIKNGKIVMLQDAYLFVVGKYGEIIKAKTGAQNFSRMENVQISGQNRTETLFIYSGMEISDTTTITNVPYINIMNGARVACDMNTLSLSAGGELDGNIELSGNVVTSYFYNVASTANEYADYRHAGDDSYEYTVKVNNLTVKKGTKLAQGSYLQVSGNCSLSGNLCVANDVGISYFPLDFESCIDPGYHSISEYPATIELVKTDSGIADLTLSSGNINEYEVGDGTCKRFACYQNEILGLPGLEIYPVTIDGDGNAAVTTFQIGDNIATFNNMKGILYSDGKTAKSIADADSLQKYVKFGVEEGVFVEYDDNAIFATGTCISVSYLGEGQDTEVSKTYTTMKRAVADLPNLADSKAGIYEFNLLENVVINSDIALPDFVTTAYFDKADDSDLAEDAVLDLRGHVLKGKGSLHFYDNVTLVSTAAGNGRIEYNGAAVDGGINLYAVDIDKVNLNAGKGNVTILPALTLTDEERLGTNAEYCIDGTITATKVLTYENCHITAVNVSSLFSAEKMPGSAVEPLVAVDSLKTSGNASEVAARTGKGLQIALLDMSGSKTGCLLADNGKKMTILSGKARNIQAGTDSILELGTVEQLKGAVSYLQQGASLYVREKATLYSPTLTAKDGTAEYTSERTDPLKDHVAVYLADKDTVLNVEGTLSRAEGVDVSTLNVGRIKEGADIYGEDDFVSIETLFANRAVIDETVRLLTAGTTWKAEALGLLVPMTAEDKGYTTVYQLGNGIYAGKPSIYIYDVTNGDRQCLNPNGVGYVKWPEAAAHFKKLKDNKKSYLIEFTDSVDLQAALSFPVKAKEITFKSIKEDEDGQTVPITLAYTGGIKLSADTTFDNIYLEQVVKKGKDYVLAGAEADYPAIVKVNAANHKLNICGDVVFNTPIQLLGGGKGSLSIAGNGQIYTNTNGHSLKNDAGTGDSLVCGSVTKFAAVNIGEGQKLKVEGYSVPSGKKMKAVAGSMDVVSLTADGGNLESEVTVNGSLKVKDLILKGNNPQIAAYNKFDITGSLKNEAEGALLTTVQQTGKKQYIPYLNITGTVLLDNPDHKIMVKVLASDCSQPALLVNRDNPVSISNQAMLLNTSKATVEQFIPYAGNVDNEPMFSAENADGYALVKTKNAIYVYYGAGVNIELRKGTPDNSQLIGYYPTFAEVVADINYRKDTDAVYTILLVRDMASETAPKAVTMPTKAKTIYISSKTDVGDDAVKTIYYTGNLTLKSGTVLDNIVLQQMAKTGKTYTATTTSVNAGNFDLILNDVEVPLGWKEIKGSGKGNLILNSTGVDLIGNLGSFRSVDVKKDMSVKGTIKTDTLQLEPDVVFTATGGAVVMKELILNGGNLLKATESQKTTIKIGSITIQGESAPERVNEIQYTRSLKNVTNLTIDGLVYGCQDPANPVIRLNMCLPEGMETEDYLYDAKYTNTYQIKPVKEKNLVNLAKAPSGAFMYSFNGSSLPESVVAVKAGKGVYLLTVPESFDVPDSGKYVVPVENVVILMKEDAVEGDSYPSCYLDWNQAVTEINNLNDMPASYEIVVGKYGMAGLRDTNVTDTSRHGALNLPGNNKAKSLTISGDQKSESEPPSQTDIYFKGNMTGYADIIFENIMLNSMKDANKDLYGQFTITMKKNSNKKAYGGSMLDLSNNSKVHPLENGDSAVKKITGVKNLTIFNGI